MELAREYCPSAEDIELNMFSIHTKWSHFHPVGVGSFSQVGRFGGWRVIDNE